MISPEKHRLGTEAKTQWVENRILQVLAETPWPLTRHSIVELAGCRPGAGARKLIELWGRNLIERLDVKGDLNGYQREFTRIYRICDDVRRALYG